MKKYNRNFFDKLVNIFGIKNVRTKFKSLKGKFLVQQDRDQDDKPIYVCSFNKIQLIGALIRNGKTRYRIITEPDDNGDQLMEKYTVK